MTISYRNGERDDTPWYTFTVKALEVVPMYLLKPYVLDLS